MFYLIKPDTNYNFEGKFKAFLTLSVLLLLGTVALVVTRGFNFGIDFTGGTVVQAKFNTPRTAEEVRTLVAEAGSPEASVVTVGQGNIEYLITVRTIQDEKETPLAEQLVANLGEDKVEILKVDVVGPKVGKELKTAAILSLFYSILFIMIYIWFRFDLKFAPGATLALIHDLILTCGFFILTGREFTIASVAALLTIAGYSVNDTIVIYDRVRELLKRGGDDLPLGATLNKAINQTLSRTVITSMLTIIAVGALMYFGRGEIQGFAMALCFGVIVGTYSTIYVASPITIFTQNFIDSRNAKAKAR